MSGMIKNIQQIDELKNIILDNNLLEKYELSRLAVFGSFARGEEANDIDLLVEDNVNYKQLLLFRSELESLLKKKVDIVIEKYANPIVLHRARKELIYVSRH